MSDPDSTMVALAALILGGAELRLAVHRLFKRTREIDRRVAALEGDRQLPELDPFDVSSGRRRSVPRNAPLMLAVLLLPLLFLGGCNEAQIARAQALSDATDAKLGTADLALANANKALAAAQDLATRVGSAEAGQLVAQAQAAVDAASSAEAVAKVTAKAGHDAVDAAKAAQAAGASTIEVLAAAAAALVPAAGGLIAVIGQAAKVAQQFRQTVAGVDNAKAKLPPEAIAVLHAELAKAQDESTKAAVKKIQAASAGSGM